MNNIFLHYLLKNFLKTFLIVVLIIYGFGIILNLFEEIEFFKNVDVSILKPLLLTSIFVPSMILNLLPFIIFISSIWFLLKIRNNKDLLTLKVYGYSNIKIFFILAFTAFIIGWVILFFINPGPSSMVKYYEQTKSKYARDIDHLMTFNKNGLWIKENTTDGQRIITAGKPLRKNLVNVTIFEFDADNLLKRKIYTKKANIESNKWILENVIVFEPINNIFEKKIIEKYEISSNYNYDKIINLFNNSDTMSFVSLLFNYENLKNNGYNSIFLDRNLHIMLVLPFFLFLMTSIASILTMHTLKRSNNFMFIILGLIICVIVYYFKDLSIALGKIDKIPLILGIWSPIIALSIFTLIGVFQINEK